MNVEIQVRARPNHLGFPATPKMIRVGNVVVTEMGRAFALSTTRVTASEIFTTWNSTALMSLNLRLCRMSK
jgi:hypothetical protein